MLVGFIDAGHLRLGAALVWMVGMGKPGPGMANFAGICIGRHAERFVPAELDLLEQDLDGLGRVGSRGQPPMRTRRRVPGTSC